MVSLLKCDYFGKWKIMPVLSMVVTISPEVHCRKDCWVQVFILKWTLFQFQQRHLLCDKQLNSHLKIFKT